MTFAEKIWKSRPDCLRIIRGFGFSFEDVEDLFQETVKNCIIHKNTFNPDRLSQNYETALDYWVKMRLRSHIKNTLKRKKRFNEIIDDQKLYNHDEKNSDFIQSPLFRGKKIKIANNGLKILENEINIIYVTTAEENKINLGDSVYFSGMDELSEITKNRLRNKNNDSLHVKDIIDKKTFTIKVDFTHDISEIGSGGENCFVEFVRKTTYLRSENPNFVLTANLKEDEQLIDIQKERCLKKLGPRERVILEYNLFPEHNNDTMFLGFKDSKVPEPKSRNDGSSLRHGDKYYKQDGDDKNLKDKNWRIFLNRTWVIAESEEIKIKPMTTERIAEKLQIAAGTVGELLSRAKQQFALCMQNAGYA